MSAMKTLLLIPVYKMFCYFVVFCVGVTEVAVHRYKVYQMYVTNNKFACF